MSNATILLNKTEDNEDARDTILLAENTVTKDNTILLPDINLNYDSGDIGDNHNTERTITDKEKTKQYIITSTDTINTAVTSEFTDYFLNYKKTDNSVTWVGNRATGTLTNVEANSRKVIPIEDFNTNVQMGIPGRNYEDKKDETNYHTWVSLHACVSDMGLHQASWNTNEAYYASHNLTYATDSNKILNVRFSHSDSMAGIKFSISYLLADGTSGTGTIELDTIVSAANDYNAYYPLKFITSGDSVKIFKLNSVEITTFPSGTTVNNGDIEFFFINKKGATGEEDEEDEDNGITSLEMSLNNTDFDYNCEYLNCQYANQYYNKNINLIQYRDDIDHTDKITFNADGVTAKVGSTVKQMYDHIEESYENNHADIGAYTGGFGVFESLFNGGNTLVLELEGGSGRKASIKIDKTNTTQDTTFKISNAGYLYNENEILRIKDYRLRDLLNFKVVSTGDEDIRTEHVQDFIKTGHGKSNTIKYALTKAERFVIKSLSISGSVKSDVIVRLIHVKNIFSATPIQYVLKEFYYYKRTNIQEKHDLNIFISNSGDIGNEIFLDIQKIVKDNNDKSREDTLNFSLNGIKYKNS